jgi:hypothetical protein
MTAAPPIPVDEARDDLPQPATGESVPPTGDGAPGGEVGAGGEASVPSAEPAKDEAPAEAGSSVPAGKDGRPMTGSVRAKKSLMDRLEAFVSRLSTKNNFWHRVCSLFWLPYAFRSGIRMKRVDEKTFTAVLPFRKFNRNWYNAMAGAALLGNSEIAGGMYVFGVCGGDYTVVCKHLQYRFLRPCVGPAIYRIAPREDIEALVKGGSEFNVTLDMDVVQQLPQASALPKVREKRVGKVEVTFHVTPKSHQKKKGRFGRKPRKG